MRNFNLIPVLIISFSLLWAGPEICAQSSPQVSIQTDSVSCFGASDGALTALPSQGQPPYSLLWSTGDTTAQVDSVPAGTYSVTVTDANGQTAVDTGEVVQPPKLSGIVVFGNPTCSGINDGQATAIPEGGTLPYTYQWSDPQMQTTKVATELEEGFYFVTVTDDNGCSTIIFVALYNEINIEIELSAMDATCLGNDGKVSVDTVINGAPPYTYLWETGDTTTMVTGLEPGIYSVTITDTLGCQAVDSIAVGIDSLLELQVDTEDVFCDSTLGSATIFINGSAPYQVIVSPGSGDTLTVNGDTLLLDSLPVGTYTVAVIDTFGCENEITFDINQQDDIELDIEVSSDTCGQSLGQITVTPLTGSGGYTYTWDPAVSTDSVSMNLFAGPYSVTVTDPLTGCQTDTVISVPDFTPLDLEAEITPASCLQADGSIVLNVLNGSGEYTYNWDPPVSDTAVAVDLSAGPYSVTITDTLTGCTLDTTLNVPVDNPLELEVIVEADSCVANSGQITLIVTGGSGDYTYEWDPPVSDTAVAVDLPAGSYSITVTDNVSGCTRDTTVEIPEASPLELEATIQPSECQDSSGAIVLTVTGGSGNYSYQWDPPVSSTNFAINIPAGPYSITVTDDETGCTLDTVIVVPEDNPLELEAEVTDTECLDSTGQIILTVTGGSGDYSYEWDPPVSDTAVAVELSAGTYSVTVTDNATGCTIDTTLTVEEDNPLELEAEVTDTECLDSTGQIILTVTGGSGDYTYEWAPPVSDTAVAVDLSAGTYSVTVTDNATGCTLDTTLTVEENNPLELEAEVIDTECLDSTGQIILTVTGGSGDYTYEWDPPVSDTAVAVELSAGTYSVTVTDIATGCTLDTTLTVEEDNPLELEAEVTDTECLDSTGQIILTVTGGSGDYSYEWDPPVSDTAVAVELSAGTYSVTVTDSATGCTIDTTLTVEEDNPLELEAEVTDTECLDSTGQIILTVTGGSGDYSYEWDPPVSDTAVAVDLSAGPYSVTITDSATGCTLDTTLTVEEDNPLELEAEVTDTECLDSTGQIILTVTGGSGDYTYEWDPPVSDTAVAVDLSAGTYSVTVTDSATGCTLDTTLTVEEDNPLELEAEVTDTECLDSTGQIILTVTGGSGDYTYEWDPPVSDTAVAVDLSAGTYSVTVTDIATGCTLDTTLTVEEDNPLELEAEVTDTECLDSTGQIILTVTGGSGDYTYEWDPPVSDTAVAVELSAGTYSVTVTDNATGCTLDTTLTVEEDNPLELEAEVTDTECLDSTGQIILTVTGGSGDYTYEWDPPVSDTAVAVELSAGTYSVTVTDNATGCTLDTTLTVEEDNPLELEAEVTDTECLDSTGQIILTVTGGSGDYTYEWDPPVSDTAVAVELSAGTYSVTVTDSATGCTLDTTLTVEEDNPLELEAEVIDTECLDSTGQIILTVTGGSGDYTYEWDPPVSDTAVAVDLSAGTYSVTVTDIATGCTLDTTLTVEEDNPLELEAEVTDTECLDSTGQIILTVTGGSGDYTYEWDPPVSDTAVAVELSAGTYSVTVTDNATGCTLDTTLTVEEDNPLELEAEVTDTECLDSTGQIILTVTGGSGDYTYEWDPPVSDTAVAVELSAGTYSVTVTDSATGCTLDTTLTVEEDNPLELEAEVTDTECLDSTGQIILTVTGGSGDYTYEWDPPVSDTAVAVELSAGTYSVTVTDNATGCTIDSTFTIIGSSNIEIMAEVDSATCPGINDGAIDLTITGGAPPYTITWSVDSLSGIEDPSGLEGGTYSVTVTDTEGCTATETIEIPYIFNLSLEADITDVACFGDSTGSITVVASGGTEPYTYLWNTGDTTDILTGIPAGTYSVTATDANGCVVVDTLEVEENGAIEIEAGITPVSCLGTADGSISLTVSGGTPPYTYQWTTPAGDTSFVDSLSAGVYGVTVTDALECQDSALLEVPKLFQPEADFTVTFDPCSVDSLVITLTDVTADSLGLISGWEWLLNDSLFSTDSSWTYTVYDSTDLKITLIVTSADGCMDTAMQQISVAPIIVNLQDTLIRCEGDSVELNPGGPEAYTYQWNPAGGLSSDTAANPLAFPDSTTTYTVQITTVQNGDTCLVMDSVTVFLPPPFTLEAPADTLICEELIGLEANSDGDVTFVWATLGGDTLAVSPSVAVSPDDTSVYVVIATDDFGCSKSDTVTVIGGAVNIELDSVWVFCQGEPGLISLNNLDLGDTLSYQWLPSGFFDSDTLAEPSFPTDSVGEFPVAVEVENQYGCTASDSALIVVLDSSSTGDFLFFGQCEPLTVNFVNNNAPYYTLFYGDPANPGASSNDKLSSYTYPVVGTYQAFLVLDTTLGTACQDTIFVDVELDEGPFLFPGFTFTGGACSDSITIQFQDTSVHIQDAIIEWSWEINGGDTVLTGPNPVYTTGDPTVIVTLSLLTSLGCEASLTDTLEFPVIELELADTLLLCRGDTLPLNQDGNPAYVYNWSPGVTLSDSTAANPLAFPQQTTTYQVNVQNFGSMDTCSLTETITVVVNEAPQFTAPDDITLCDDVDTLLVASSPLALDYLWALDPAFGNIVGEDSILLANPLNERPRIYYLQVTDANGCVAVDSVAVGNYEAALFLPDTLLICLGDTLELSAVNTIPGDTLIYSWSSMAPILSGTDGPSILVAPETTSFFEVQVENQFGCSLTEGTLVLVDDYVLGLTAVADPETINIGGSSQLDVIIDRDGNYMYQWIPEDSLDFTDIPNPIASPDTTTTYTVNVVNENGCEGTDSVTIRVEVPPCEDPYIFIPNAFTPNGDGINDILFVRGVHIDELNLQIYNRWGQLVFETDDPSVGWDGNFKGQPAPQEVYGYVLEVNCIGGEQFQKQGNISLFR